MTSWFVCGVEIAPSCFIVNFEPKAFTSMSSTKVGEARDVRIFASSPSKNLKDFSISGFTLSINSLYDLVIADRNVLSLRLF